jgi:hypothetical protein
VAELFPDWAVDTEGKVFIDPPLRKTKEGLRQSIAEAIRARGEK